MSALVMTHNRLDHPLHAVSDVPSPKRKTSEVSPADVSQFVSAKESKPFSLHKPKGATFREVKLEDTIYKENFLVVNGWGKFFLPNVVTMKVIGVVEGISCPCEQLVLMSCEGQQVYAYDDEELHLVASSVKELYKEGIQYPASKTYYWGEAFKDMPSENRADTSSDKSPLEKRLDEEYKKLVEERKSSFLENL